ncbi:lysine biosynthesis protein LysW [Candidatus Microgenomates bacterium]|nr:MAG: lysine biosynthesis protein LysW [Candidatus Microgenomates bacterium]
MHQAACPICDGQVTIPENTEVSEILTCSECNNRVVVAAIDGDQVTLEKAPEVEEDWGE